MPYSLSIALRYLRERRRRGLISRVTGIAIAGTFVGVAVLIVVLSLMNGFTGELRDRIVEFNTHVLVFARTPGAWARIDSVAARETRMVRTIVVPRGEYRDAAAAVPRARLRG